MLVALLFTPVSKWAEFRTSVASRLAGLFFIRVIINLSFQWFGNLVTMSWWSDLWLNEGFATWLGYKVGNMTRATSRGGKLFLKFLNNILDNHDQHSSI